MNLKALDWYLKTRVIKIVAALNFPFGPFLHIVLYSLFIPLPFWAAFRSFSLSLLLFLCFAAKTIRYGKDISCGPFLPPVIPVRAGRKAITGWEMSTKVERAGVEISGGPVPFVPGRILIASPLYLFLFLFLRAARECHGQTFAGSRMPWNMIIRLASQRILLNATKQKMGSLKYLIQLGFIFLFLSIYRYFSWKENNFVRLIRIISIF